MNMIYTELLFIIAHWFLACLFFFFPWHHSLVSIMASDSQVDKFWKLKNNEIYLGTLLCPKQKAICLMMFWHSFLQLFNSDLIFSKKQSTRKFIHLDQCDWVCDCRKIRYKVMFYYLNTLHSDILLLIIKAVLKFQRSDSNYVLINTEKCVEMGWDNRKFTQLHPQ